MKLMQWARQEGLSRATAYRLFHSGKLPIPSKQLDTDTILVYPPEKGEAQYVVYARVSSADQKKDLDQQIARVMAFAGKQKLPVVDTVTEIGSGLNGHRKRLQHILSATPHHVIVEHRDRLCRFGFDYLQAALRQSGRSIVVADETELTDDIVRDLHEVIVSMCARLYGKRAAANKAARALAEVAK
jgi:predicted site-specific integrase-resolvase